MEEMLRKELCNKDFVLSQDILTRQTISKEYEEQYKFISKYSENHFKNTLNFIPNKIICSIFNYVLLISRFNTKLILSFPEYVNFTSHVSTMLDSLLIKTLMEAEDFTEKEAKIAIALA